MVLKSPFHLKEKSSLFVNCCVLGVLFYCTASLSSLLRQLGVVNDIVCFRLIQGYNSQYCMVSIPTTALSSSRTEPCLTVIFV